MLSDWCYVAFTRRKKKMCPKNKTKTNTKYPLDKMRCTTRNFIVMKNKKTHKQMLTEEARIR